jgi:copper chaperone NosL
MKAMISVVATSAMLACTGGPPEPVEIVLNEANCSHCRMAVSQREFAAEVVTVSGSVDTFDDIGCLGIWVKEHQPPESAGLFVVDHDTGEWVDAREAFFVLSKKLPTPMSSGLAAFKTEESARAAAERLEGKVILWETVLAGETH